MYSKEKTEQALFRVHEVIKSLLDSEKGCIWDKEQTPESLSEYLIEECFEYVDAVRKNKPAHAMDEMGDVLFLLCHSATCYALSIKEGQDGQDGQDGQEGNEASNFQAFDLADALNCAADKMIRRHPHVFADAHFSTQEEHIQSWAAIKKAEKAKENSEEKGLYSNLVNDLPALTKAYRVHSKAAQIGFTWEKDEEVEQQIEAEWLELVDALQDNRKEDIEHELGDLIFSLAELGRRKGIKLSIATDKAVNRFLSRFEGMECLAKERGLDFETLSLDEKDELWNEVKSKEANLSKKS